MKGHFNPSWVTSVAFVHVSIIAHIDRMIKHSLWCYCLNILQYGSLPLLCINGYARVKLWVWGNTTPQVLYITLAQVLKLLLVLYNTLARALERLYMCTASLPRWTKGYACAQLHFLTEQKAIHVHSFSASLNKRLYMCTASVPHWTKD